MILGYLFEIHRKSAGIPMKWFFLSDLSADGRVLATLAIYPLDELLEREILGSCICRNIPALLKRSF
jgi:hypothetical protein